VGALKHCDVASQKPLADATKQAKESAASCPNAFHRIIVDFTNAITVIIARPLAVPRCVADGLVTTAGGGEVLIGRPLVSVDGRIVTGMGHDQPFQCGAIRVFAEP
jgi:hypothetical protein